MALTQAQAQTQIAQHAAVSRQLVQLAKKVIAASDQHQVSSSRLIANVLAASDLRDERPLVILNDRYDPSEDIRSAGRQIAWTRAAIQAIWEMTYASWFIPAGDVQIRSFEVTFTTVYGNSGGTTGSYAFTSMELPVPVTLYLAAGLDGTAGMLRDPDLFMSSMAISNLGDDVRDALAEAIRCFKRDLFAAAVAMLGKASEGAWIELGGCSVVPPRFRMLFRYPCSSSGRMRKAPDS